MRKHLAIFTAFFYLAGAICVLSAAGEEEAGEEESVKSQPVSDRDSEEVYWKFLDICADSYMKSEEDPDAAIERADELVEFNDSLDGYEFESGRKFRKDSSFLLFAYIGYIRACSAKKDCDKAKEYFMKFKEAEDEDYLVVNPLLYEVYDPVIDKEIYGGKKADMLSLMAGFMFPDGRCLGVEEIKSLKLRKEEEEYLIKLYF